MTGKNNNSKFWFMFAVLAATAQVAYSQPITCSVSAPAPPVAPATGESELVSDLLLTCITTAPSQSFIMNVQVTVNTNVTSRITNTASLANEALLLIDDPKPGVANTSNTFPYFGQVRGTSGVLAGAPGSGNVYQGMQLTSGGVVEQNVVLFEGIPYVTAGTRTFRITNVRANVSSLGPNPVNAFVSINTDIAIGVVNPEVIVAHGMDALKFTSGPLAGAVGLDLSFAERFPDAFKKRIENTLGGPLTLNHQDEPATLYCTESGFTPSYESLTTGDVGIANTGTRLLGLFQGVPVGVTALTVPNQATSSSGDLVAHRVLPPFGADFSAGTVTTAAGYSTVWVSAAHTAELLYQVTAAAPYLGINGCGAMDTFNIGVIPSIPLSLGAVVVTGELAPRDSVSTASATAPEPRFRP